MPRYIVGGNRKRELAIQLALMARIEAKFARTIRRQINQSMKAGIDQYEKDGSDFGVEAVVRSYNSQIQSSIAADWRSAAETFGNRILDAGKKSKRIEVKLDLGDVFGQSVNDFIRTYTATKVRQISQTTVRQIRAAISAGEVEGLGVREIARQIRDRVPSIARVRSEVIARTETHTAANYGASEAALATGLELRKEWLAAEDDRTREDHALADGQIVGMAEMFEVGDIFMKYPGDPSAPPEQVINCRCSVGYLEA